MNPRTTKVWLVCYDVFFPQAVSWQFPTYLYRSSQIRCLVVALLCSLFFGSKYNTKALLIVFSIFCNFQITVDCILTSLLS